MKQWRRDRLSKKLKNVAFFAGKNCTESQSVCEFSLCHFLKSSGNTDRKTQSHNWIRGQTWELMFATVAAHRITASSRASLLLLFANFSFTWKRRLRDAGLQSELGHQNIAKKKHHHWTSEDWKKMFWTDKSLIFGLSYRICVHCQNGEKMATQCVTQTFKHRGGSVFVLGCFTGSSVGDLNSLRDSWTITATACSVTKSLLVWVVFDLMTITIT